MATMRTVVVSSVLACAVLLTATHEGRGQSEMDAAAAVAAEGDGSNFDARRSSKAMGEAASRLKDEVADKARKLQELESGLSRNQQSGSIVQAGIGDIVLILNGAADELAPDSPYRAALVREAVGLREAASQAAVNVDRGARQKAPYLQQKVAEIEAAARDAEELRTRLLTHVDLFEALGQRVQFAGTAARAAEQLKDAQGYLDRVQSVASRAEQLANELYARETGVANVSTSTAQPSSIAAPPSNRQMQQRSFPDR